MKILLFGMNGQLGWELQRSLAPLGELVALGRSADFLYPQRLAERVLEIQPDVVVNAAAYTAVDQAESEPDTAFEVNAVAPGVLAQAAHACGAWMVHYSSDYVFDGTGSRPWRETDSPGPLNVYGASKLAGEQRVAEANPLHLILRTSWVYSARGGNFAKTMLRLARERERLSVIDDQFGAPTGADLLADITAHALRAAVLQPALAGTYHAAAAGETTWHAYARHVLAQAQGAGMVLRATPDRVDPVPTQAFPSAARRPANSRLDTTALRAAFQLHLPPWQAGIDRMLGEISTLP